MGMTGGGYYTLHPKEKAPPTPLPPGANTTKQAKIEKELELYKKALDKACEELQCLHTELIKEKGYHYLDGRPQTRWWHK